MSIKAKDQALIGNIIGVETPEDFKAIQEYGAKIFFKLRRNYPSLPGDSEFVEQMISQALAEAMFGFDPTAGTEFKTYFHDKILGVITKYIKKINTTNTVGGKLAAAGEVVISYTGDGEVVSEAITTETPEDILLKEEETTKRIEALRMSRSDLPMFLQRVLYSLTEYDKIDDAASVLGLTKEEFKIFRDNALSLLFKKLLRSSHLSEDEREKLKVEYKLV